MYFLKEKIAKKKLFITLLIATLLTTGFFLLPVIAQQPGFQKIKNGLSLIFQEGRQWQIASDAISLRAEGTWSSGTANITPAIPAAQVTGDMMLLFYGTKPYSDAPTINQGWTLLGSTTNGTTASGVDTGSMKTVVWYKIATSDTETDPTVTNTTNSVSGGVIIVFQKGSGEAWETPVGAGGGDTTAGTAFAATSSSDVGHKAGDMLVGYAAIRSDSGTQSSITITATGLTVGSFTESPATDLSTSAGQDMAMSGGYVLATAGTSSAPPVYKSTLAGNYTGTAFVVRLRRNQSPTVVLNSPADASSTIDTTPVFNFTGTDGESNDIRYNLQILGTNLVTNPSFETDAASTSPPTEWSNLNAGTNVLFRGVSTDFAQSGSKSWKITSTAGTVDDGLQQTAGSRTSATTIEVTPGVTYRFSAFIKTAITNSGNAHIHVKLFKTGYANQADYDVSDLISGTTDWTESSMEITIPTDYVIAELILCAGAYGNVFTGSVWFDNVIVAPILYDKVSGTDAGFSGSPDNSDPFASGQAVDYAVQSALAGGTYYWRVRGLDPAGGNAYGSWTTMRSLIITNAPPTVVLNSPADASSTSDPTPTFDFTGTDAQSEDVRYNLQILGANLIANPGFETDASGTNPPTEWGNVNVVGATRGVATDFAHSGSKSWKISTTTPAADAGLQQTVSTRTSGLPITVVPGVTYRFSAFIKTAISNSGNAHIHVKLFKTGYTNETGYDSSFVTGTTDWTENSIEITIPTDFVLAEVMLCTGAYGTAFTGSVWFDDVSVTSLFLNKVSGTDAGFANPDVGGDTDPFTSGDNIQYTVQVGDALTAGTYYWRVRGLDPAGTNTYGAWSTTRSLVVLTNTAPTIVLNTPADTASITDTTPTFDFTGTDAQSEDVEYNVQILTNLNPIAFVATSTSGALSATSSFSWNHTIAAGSNRILVVAVGTRDASSGVSGITYHSVALTKARSDVHTFSPYAKSELWYLVNPDVGTYPIAVTLSDVADFAAAVASNWTGVDQANPILVNNGSNGTSVSGVEVSRAATTTLDNSMLIESVYSKSDPTLFTDKAGQTTLSKLTPNSNGDTFISSYKLASTLGANSMAFTDTEGADYAFSVIALSPAVLLSKFSTTDAGFVNPDVGGDTHPFTSGDNIQYTVQVGDALTAGTYYWRVRGLDPAGTDIYGAAVTRSFTLSTNITVSGTAYNYGTAVKLSACDASTTTYELALRVGGATYNASCSNSDGTFSFSNVTAPSAGDGMVIWINGTSTYGATVSRYDGSGDSTGNSLYSNTVFLTSDDTTTLTTTHMDVYDNTNDSDIPYTASTTGTVTVNDGFELGIAASKTFTPGGAVTTSVSGSSTSPDGTVRVAAGGTLNMGSNNLSVGGNFYNSGTFTQTSATTTMTATSTGFVASSTTFANLEFNGSGGGWTFTSTPTVAGNMTVTAGTLSGTVGATVNGGNVTGSGTITLTNGTFLLDGVGSFGGSTAWTFYNLTFGDGSGVATSTKSGTGTTTVSNVLTIAASQILNAGTAPWVVSGAGTPFVITGTFTASSSTFKYSGTSATNVATTTYYNLELKPTGSSPTYTIATGTLTVSNNFTVGDGSNAVTVTANTNDPTVDVNGMFTINASGVYQASNTSGFTIAGNYTNNGTFTANSATTTFDGSAQQTLSGSMIGSNTFYNLKITNNSGTNPDTSPSIIFAAAASSTNFFAQTASTTIRFLAGGGYTFTNFYLNGGATASRVALRSSITGTAWRLYVTGAQSVLYANPKDSDASGGSTINASDGTSLDGTGNTNWNFGGGSLSFSLSANLAYFGYLNSGSVRFASSTGLGGSTSEVVAHTMTASTTASSGYTISILGASLTRGGFTISPIGASIASSTPGTEQFGLRATASGGTGAVASRYSTLTSYAYNATDVIVDTLASTSGASTDTVYSLYYMANIGALTEAGQYSTAITYVITANY